MRRAQGFHAAILNMLAGIVHRVDGTARRRAELEEYEHLAADEQEKMAMSRCRDLLDHAFENVPYYSRLAADHGLQPRDFTTYEDLQKLPLMTKEQIQSEPEIFVADDGTRGAMKQNHTGGSTGEPLTFYQDEPYRAYNGADKMRLYERTGYRIGDPLVFFWGSPVDADPHRTVLGRLYDRFAMNLLWINTFDLSEDLLEQYAPVIAKHDPLLIVGYTICLNMYANYLAAHPELPRPSPLAVQASSEILTPATRKRIQDVLDCEVYDRYGCREVGMLAHECEAHNGLHVAPMPNIVELIDDEGKRCNPGEPGRVIATCLTNRTMPFIRYEVGDYAVWAEDEECSCGRKSPRFENLYGRGGDIIVSPGGKVLHTGFFTDMFYGVTSVKQFRVIQHSYTDIEIQIVPSNTGDQLHELQSEILEMTHTHGDPEFEVSFSLKRKLDPLPSGKRTWVISHVDHQFAR